MKKKTIYKEMEKRAKALAKQLGKGWKINLWQDKEGWHCHVFMGKFTVYPERFDSIDPKSFGPGSACVILANLRKVIRAANHIRKFSKKTNVPVNFVMPTAKAEARRAKVYETVAS